MFAKNSILSINTKVQLSFFIYPSLCWITYLIPPLSIPNVLEASLKEG
nr:MAG TPA: hypothetical protein [Caudoviricetes sp.]